MGNWNKNYTDIIPTVVSIYMQNVHTIFMNFELIEKHLKLFEDLKSIIDYKFNLTPL